MLILFPLKRMLLAGPRTEVTRLDPRRPVGVEGKQRNSGTERSKNNFLLDILVERGIRYARKHQGWVISLFPLSLRSQP